MTEGYALANPLELQLDKPRASFTRSDLIHIIKTQQIERITFHYVDLNGRLHDLKLPISSDRRANRILANGERLDGSSIFKGVIDPGLSDLYVVPQYATAFLNPFEPGSLDVMCRFFTRDGEPAAFTPDTLLQRSAEAFRADTGLTLHAMGELEFYLFQEPCSTLYPNTVQAGYHASPPFSKASPILNEMLTTVSRILGSVKYAHGEVGYIPCVESDNAQLKGKQGEQLEIEFLPTPIETTGDILVLAKWIIRNIAYRHQMLAVFAPKIEEGMAGNGLHIHMALMQDCQNIMQSANGDLSPQAHHLIGGLAAYAPSLTAFGNTMASSYLRLVPHQEAPTRICWSASNRSALIRVPLGWAGVDDLAAKLNPQQDLPYQSDQPVQTVELRSPDGSAIPHLLLAGIVTAARWGLTHPEEAGAIARAQHVTGNIFANPKLLERLPSLPVSCADSAARLLTDRHLYEKEGLFPARMIDRMAALLHEEQDETLAVELENMNQADRARRGREIMHRDINRH